MFLVKWRYVQKERIELKIRFFLFFLKIDGKLPVAKDRNDGLMLRGNICLQKLIEIAAQRRRNYIIDHVNRKKKKKYRIIFLF
jgi:hypothetical protein